MTRKLTQLINQYDVPNVEVTGGLSERREPQVQLVVVPLDCRVSHGPQIPDW